MAADALRRKRAIDSDRLLSQFLAQRDVPCPTCAYNLRDLQSAVCPECGETLRLQVGAVTPRIGLLGLLISPLLMLMGIALLMTVATVLYGPPPGWGFYLLELTALADVVGCIVIYRRRSYFLRQERGTQVALVVVTWAFQVTLATLSVANFA